MLSFAPVAFIGPDALDHMARSSRIARSAMAAQRWSVAPTVLRWCAARLSTDGWTLDLRGPQLAKQGRIVVSMKDDWERIFAFE
jgi:hypothetical protein